MSDADSISPPGRRRRLALDVPIRQLAIWWPHATARVLETLPATKVNGRWTLQELGAFARTAELDGNDLLTRLSEAADVPAEPSSSMRRRLLPAPMGILMLAMVTGITLGAAWGVGLLLRIALGGDYAIVPPASIHVHGLAQLWGWLALFVLGVGSHLLRQNTKSAPPTWLDVVAATAIVVALLAFSLSLAPAVRIAWPWIDVTASALLTLAAILIAASFTGTLMGRGQKPQRWHLFVLSAIAWLLAWALADLVLRIRHVGSEILPDSGRQLLIALPVLGFATNAIYGFGIRVLPGLLNITKPRPGPFAVTLILHNVGLLVLLLVPYGEAPGSALMLAGAVFYLVGLHLLRSQPSRPIFGADSRSNWLIRAAFAWLILGLAMVLGQSLWALAGGMVHHAFTGAWRHALTVGFVTTMILGVGFRLLPVFLRQPLFSPRLMVTSAVLILVGNAWRVSTELLTMGEWTWAYRLMGISGLLELTALILFALNILLTCLQAQRFYDGQRPVGPATRVREIVNARPQVQHQLEELGVQSLQKVPVIPPSLLVGQMALTWGWDPKDLADRLNE